MCVCAPVDSSMLSHWTVRICASYTHVQVYGYMNRNTNSYFLNGRWSKSVLHLIMARHSEILDSDWSLGAFAVKYFLYEDAKLSQPTGFLPSCISSISAVSLCFEMFWTQINISHPVYLSSKQDNVQSAVIKGSNALLYINDWLTALYIVVYL